MRIAAPGTIGNHSAVRETRKEVVARALRLEYLTVGWNIGEGLIALTAALIAGSIVLVGFGVDSFVESASGGVLIWRFFAEREARDDDEIDKLDRRAHKLVALSLFGLAAFVVLDAAHALRTGKRPEPSHVGIAVTAVSIGVMWWLARAKRRTAVVLRSRALEADAFQTTACWWLSLVTLGGLGLNAVLGWWWADPVAALGMAYFLVREGREAWCGEECCAAFPCNQNFHAGHLPAV